MKIWIPNWKRRELGLIEITPWSKFNPWTDCKVLTESNSGKALLIYVASVGDFWMPKKACSFRIEEDEQLTFTETWNLPLTTVS